MIIIFKWFLQVLISVALLLTFFLSSGAQAQGKPSTCLAIAQSLPNVVYASADMSNILKVEGLASHEVRITFSGHSTYIIESEKGVTIATDFAGYAGAQVPRVVTMNRAHSSHFTDFPDPEIKHVLRGWNPDGGPASHYLKVVDVLIRNVTTDILTGGLRMINGNSIFILEVAGLCIGHLGHLHHALTEEHYAKIGRLDVVMVPIDGAMTMSLGGMSEIVKRLRSSIVLPMHARGFATPADFISMLGSDFDHVYLKSRSIVVSLFDLPKRPTVMVPEGLVFRRYDE
ncbi:MAG: MBL fold metallo-hydrolase [Rhizobiaceae bacterium]